MFKLEYSQKGENLVDNITIDDKVMFCFDCSCSMNVVSTIPPNDGQERVSPVRINFSDIIDILNCYIVKIEYEEAGCINMRWNMPKMIVLERDDYQLTITKVGWQNLVTTQEKIKDKIQKNADNLHYGKPIIHEYYNEEFLTEGT